MKMINQELEIIIELKFKNLQPEGEGKDDAAEHATSLKKEEIRAHALGLKSLMGADSVSVYESDEYEADEWDDDDEQPRSKS